MKTFDEIRGVETEDLNESRLLRKGGALLLARSAKKHGDDATRCLNDAKRRIKGSSSDNDKVGNSLGVIWHRKCFLLFHKATIKCISATSDNI